MYRDASSGEIERYIKKHVVIDEKGIGHTCRIEFTTRYWMFMSTQTDR